MTKMSSFRPPGGGKPLIRGRIFDGSKRIKFLALAALAFIVKTPAPAQPCPSAAILDAIWHIEGGRRASSPYGVLCCTWRQPIRARRLASNIVHSACCEWNTLDLPKKNTSEFFSILAQKYCPSDRKNWAKNLRSRLKHHGYKL